MTSTTYTVFIDKKVDGVPPVTKEVDVPDNYTEVERSAHLQIELDVMVHNEIEQGWYPNIITDLKG